MRHRVFQLLTVIVVALSGTLSGCNVYVEEPANKPKVNVEVEPKPVDVNVNIKPKPAP